MHKNFKMKPIIFLKKNGAFLVLTLTAAILFACGSMSTGSSGTSGSSTTSKSNPYDPSGGVYTASGTIKCWNTGQNPNNQCPFGVIRRAGGDADVYVKRPDGSERVIYFQNGKAVGYDRSGGDHGEFNASVGGGDTWLIMIGNERYEIVEAIVYGG